MDTQRRALSLVGLDGGPVLSPVLERVDVDALPPHEVLAVFGSQLDELARMVEAALGEEDAWHQRRRALLKMLANQLGQQQVGLDEVAHQLTQTSPPAGGGGA